MTSEINACTLHVQHKMQAAGHLQVREALQGSLDEATIFKEAAEAELAKVRLAVTSRM